MEPGDPTEAGADDLTVRQVTASAVPQHVSDERGRLEPGARIDRYHVVGLLGRGGMGEVYRGYDPELDRPLAIKLIRASAPHGDGARTLLREARALARLSHPNVVTIYDVGTHEGEVWLAMELVEGLDLATWSKKPRSLGEIRDVFVAAARGLAAAHAAGLVHRDFKPANVFVGDPRGAHGHDARVRVGDFGLARAGPTDATMAASDLTMRGLDTGCTGSGMVAGTPPYMAPEVHVGAVADARADQYAFFIAFHEALFGKRPFVGRDMIALLAAKREGLRAVPTSRPIPAWLRRLLLRGLAPDPADRHPSMAAVVHELERHSGRRRIRNAALLAGAATALGIGIGTLGAREPVVDRCAHTDALVDAVWNDDRRSQVEASLRGNGSAHGHETASRVTATLDRYATRWRSVYRAHCEATPDVGVVPWQELDPRTRCLRHRLFVVDALAQSMIDDARGVSRVAVVAVDDLPLADRCAEQALASERIEPPGELLDRVEDVRAELDRVEALHAMAKTDEAVLVLDGVADEVAAVEFRPLRAEYRFWRGIVEADRQSGEPAERELFAALWEAEASGHDEMAWRAARRLIVTLAVDRRDPTRAREWAPLAEALALRVGEVETRIPLEDLRGIVSTYAGNYDEAEQHFRTALALAETNPGDARHVASILDNLAYVLLRRREYLASEPLLRRAIGILRERLGDHHPSVAQSLNQLAAALEASGRGPEAEALFEEALAILVDFHGETHPATLHALNNLGTIAVANGDYARARRWYERGLAALDVSRSDRWFELAGFQHNLAEVALKEGDLTAAIEGERLAIATAKREDDPQHRVLVPAMLGLATMARQCGARQLAAVALARVRGLADWERVDPAGAAENDLYAALLAIESDDLAEAARLLDGALGRSAAHDDEVTFAMRSELFTLRAKLERQRGRCDAARVHIDHAFAQADRAANAAPLRLFAHAERAEIRHCNREHEEAAQDERAVVGADAPAPALLRARARLALARALWSLGELVLARAAAQEARTHARTDDRETASPADESADAWLRAHTIRCPEIDALADIAREL